MNNVLAIMYKNNITPFGAFLVLSTCYILHATPVLAQESPRTMTIVPPSIDKVLTPGDRTEGIMKVINDSDIPLTFTADTQDFIVEDTKGTPNLLPLNTLLKRYSGSAWIAVTPSIFTVQPHQKQLLTYYIQIPTDARPGGHYAAIVYNPSELIALGNTGTAVQTQIGTLFSIRIPGPIVESAKATVFYANTFQEYGPVTIFTQIKNFSDVHTRPQGYILVQDMVGRKIETLPLEEHNIFPGAARDYVNIFGQPWMFGRFKATLIASYGVSNNIPLTATMYFWVFPWKVTLVIALIILAIILTVMVWKKQQDKLHEEENEHIESM